MRARMCRVSSPAGPRTPRVFSLAQPTADSLHLGNYLGALRWVPLQADHEAFYGVADLHALTVETDPKTLAAPAQRGDDRGRHRPGAVDRFPTVPRPRAHPAGLILGCLTGFGQGG